MTLKAIREPESASGASLSVPARGAIHRLLAALRAVPEVPAMSNLGSPGVLGAARRALQRVGFSPALLGEGV